MRFVYYALPHEAWRLRAINLINRAIFSGARRSQDKDDIIIGRLLGYSSWEIHRFVRRQMRKTDGALGRRPAA